MQWSCNGWKWFNTLGSFLSVCFRTLKVEEQVDANTNRILPFLKLPCRTMCADQSFYAVFIGASFLESKITIKSVAKPGLRSISQSYSRRRTVYSMWFDTGGGSSVGLSGALGALDSGETAVVAGRCLCLHISQIHPSSIPMHPGSFGVGTIAQEKLKHRGVREGYHGRGRTTAHQHNAVKFYSLNKKMPSESVKKCQLMLRCWNLCHASPAGNV